MTPLRYAQSAVESITVTFVGRKRELEARAKLARRIAGAAPILTPTPSFGGCSPGSTLLGAPLLGHSSSMRLLAGTQQQSAAPPLPRTLSLATGATRHP